MSSSHEVRTQPMVGPPTHLALMVNEVAGERWLTPDRFRFGASSLLNDLLQQRHKLATGVYDGPDYVTVD